MKRMYHPEIMTSLPHSYSPPHSQTPIHWDFVIQGADSEEEMKLDNVCDKSMLPDTQWVLFKYY